MHFLLLLLSTLAFIQSQPVATTQPTTQPTTGSILISTVFFTREDGYVPVSNVQLRLLPEIVATDVNRTARREPSRTKEDVDDELDDMAFNRMYDDAVAVLRFETEESADITQPLRKCLQLLDLGIRQQQMTAKNLETASLLWLEARSAHQLGSELVTQRITAETDKDNMRKHYESLVWKVGWDVIDRSAIGYGKTGKGGKLRFHDVPLGRYHLIGRATFPQIGIVIQWSRPIEVTAGVESEVTFRSNETPKRIFTYAKMN